MQENAARLREAIEAKLLFKNISGYDHNYVCPFCTEQGADHTLHVAYDKGEHGVAICHGCWYKCGNLKNLVRDIYGFIPKSLDRFLRRPQLVLDIEKFLADNGAAKQRVSLPAGCKKLPSRPTDTMSRVMLAYLKSRGFTYDDIDEYEISYVPFPEEDQSLIANYIIFPFRAHGRVVYWQGRRCMGSASNKSYNPPKTGKRNLLFGYEQAVGKSTLFLCEGPLDAISWGPGGLALTSKVLQPEQVRVLSLMECKRLIVCLDPEEAKRTKELAVELQRHVPYKVGYLILKHGDPADNKGRIHRLARRDTKWVGKGWLPKTVRGVLDEPVPRKPKYRKTPYKFEDRVVEYLGDDFNRLLK